MKVFAGSSGYLIRLERGEEIHESLGTFAREQGIRGGVVQGIGAVHESEVGFYHLEKRVYEKRQIPEITELLSLTGNLSQVDGKPFLHLHVVLMRPDFTVTGGHLFRSTIAVTGEFAFSETGLEVVRLPDPDVGLALLEPGPGG